jgi:hypothetical protein
MQCTRSSILAVVVAAFAAQPAAAQDTVRVRADNSPLWGANVRLVQEVAIGQLDDAPEYSFGRIHAATAAPNGDFYLFDSNDRQLRRYDRAGKFLNLVGKRGGGPGEYQYVAGMDITRDGLLVIKDPENSRVTYFHPDGKVQRDFPVLRFGFYGTNFVTDTAGLVYMVVSVGAAMTEGPGSRQQFLRLKPDGMIHDSIALPDRYGPRDAPRPFWLSTSDGMRWNFTPQQLSAAYVPGGIVSGQTHAYRFVITQPGKRPLVVERRHTPLPLGEEEREDWMKWVEYFRTRPGGRGATYELPNTKPAIRELRSDHLGRIWVEVFVKAEKRNEPPRPAGDVRPVLTWKERTTYDVFAPGGEYLGRIGLPAQSTVLAIRDNRLITLTRGPDGEERIVVFRLAIPDRP